MQRKHIQIGQRVKMLTGPHAGTGTVQGIEGNLARVKWTTGDTSLYPIFDLRRVTTGKRVKNPARRGPPKGRVPPHLKKYLFKKGHRR